MCFDPDALLCPDILEMIIINCVLEPVLSWIAAIPENQCLSLNGSKPTI
jgi:hypothetical protein